MPSRSSYSFRSKKVSTSPEEIPNIFIRFNTSGSGSPSPATLSVSVAVDLMDGTGSLASMVHKYSIVIRDDRSLTTTGRERVRLYRTWKNQCESRRISPILRQLDSFDHVLSLGPGATDLFSLLEPMKRSMNLERQCTADMNNKWSQMLGSIEKVQFRFFATTSDKLNWFSVEYGIGGEFESEEM